MHENMPPPEPDFEQLNADLLAKHHMQPMKIGEQTVTFEEFDALGRLMCEYAVNSSPEDQVKYKLKKLHENGATLEDKYIHLLPSDLKQEQLAKNKSEPTQDKVNKRAEKVVDKTESKTVESVPVERQEIKTVPDVNVSETVELKHKKVVPVPKAAIDRTVQLELPTVEKIKAIEDPVRQMRAEVIHIPIEQIRNAELNALTEEIVKPMEHRESAFETIESALEESVYNHDVLQEEVLQLSESETQQAHTVEVGEDGYVENAVGDIVVGLHTEESIERTAEITDMVLVEEAPMTIVGEESAPDAELLYELESVPPVTVTTEFIAQVLPTKLEAIAEQLETMEPEVATELASRIEMIVVVADRLHDLVVAEATEGEEAKQIVSFLKREYEQVLLAVGIEVTDEILEEFIAYIFSDSYTLQVSSAANYVDVADEGTHEKKLFDEQSVFAKAQNASTILGQKLGNSIGHILLTKLAS